MSKLKALSQRVVIWIVLMVTLIPKIHILSFKISKNFCEFPSFCKKTNPNQDMNKAIITHFGRIGLYSRNQTKRLNILFPNNNNNNNNTSKRIFNFADLFSPNNRKSLFLYSTKMKRTDETEVLDPQLKAEREARKKQKEAEKAAKEAAKLAKKEAQAAEQQAANALLNRQAKDENDDFGYWPLITSDGKTKPRKWISVKDLHKHTGEHVWLRARVQDCRGKGALAFLILRDRADTVQLVLDASKGVISKDMIKWTCSVPMESIIDVFAEIITPETPIQSTSQKTCELHAKRVFCISKAAKELPFQFKDAIRPENDTTEGAIRVNLDTRLDNRILDLRTPVSQSIFKIQSGVCQLFRNFLLKEGFVEIHSPKLIGGASEGGANCFTLKYFGRDGCLAQSPQLYKQMAICGDFDRVFEIGPVFRAENSNTHRHMCEFTGLDVEMAFKDHYFEVLDVLDNVFKSIFSGLVNEYATEIETIRQQFDCAPFKWQENTPRIDFCKGVEMLRKANCPNIPDDITEFDLSTEQEKFLGHLVKEEYNADYYILTRFPSKVRAFYSMPCPKDPTFSNSYDFYMRGEEIVSGAQRIHDADKLREKIIQSGIPPETLSSYIDSFKLGAPPHAGMGVGLERVVMLFLGLGNIRRVSMFPRDPKRLTP